ncbi:MarR family winged helix-turn-helix transcriptional regulator [Paenirhodobacter enshiensis]|uniref:MarR family winged helix-turn-helix transcriptional regulator n=1 Tax=Paenirhodobacter enshiensis TaxID=1105367 RepID=UPI0035B1C8E4
MTSDLTSPRARLGRRFAVLARRWRQVLDARLTEAGLSAATWVPLVHLDDMGDGIAQAELARRISLDASSLVRLLDILCRQGLVERRPDPVDGRVRQVVLTPEGHARVAEISRELARSEAELLAGLSDDDIAGMLAGFDKIDLALTAARSPRQE